ncbi:MAG: LemA family protein [Myxococcota bacterium]
MLKFGCAALVAGAVGLLGVAAVVFVVPWYNQVIHLEEEVKREWAQVDVVLQKRYDLVAQMMASVRGETGQEREVFFGLANARSDYDKSANIDDKIEASRRAEGYMSRLMYAGQLFPTLRSSGGFSEFRAALQQTENELATQRQRYNDAVGKWNAAVRSVEGNIASLFMTLELAGYYESADAAAVSPQVDLTPGLEGMEARETAKGAPRGARRQTGEAGTDAAVGGLSGLDRVNLRGTLESDGGLKAIVELPSGVTKTVGVGDKLLEVRAEVAEIEPGSVIFIEHGDEGRRRVRVSLP